MEALKGESMANIWSSTWHQANYEIASTSHIPPQTTITGESLEQAEDNNHHTQAIQENSQGDLMKLYVSWNGNLVKFIK